jgi:hypothetical protein
MHIWIKKKDSYLVYWTIKKKNYLYILHSTEAEYSLSKMAGIRYGSDFKVFGILEYLHIYILRYLGDELKSKHKTHLHFIYTLYIELEDNFIQYFCAPMIWLCMNGHMRSGMEFSICDVMLMCKKFQILEDFKFLY